MTVAPIRIPVEKAENNFQKKVGLEEIPINTEDLHVQPIYYATDEANVDSYLVPSNLHKPQEVLQDMLVTPATFLLPPALDTQNEYYYKPTEPGDQTDWYPIIASPQKQIEAASVLPNERPEPQIINENLRKGKVLESHGIPVPSRNLLPPHEDAPNNFIILSPSVELELPLEEIDHTLKNDANPEKSFILPVAQFEKKYPLQLRSKTIVPLPFIIPPKRIPQEYKNPTLLYPKKYHNDFKPIPIPITELDKVSAESPTVRTKKPLNASALNVNNNNYYFVPADHKNVYLYEQGDQKRKLKNQEATQSAANTDESHKENPTEQEASETHYRESGHNVHPYHSNRAPLAPLKQPVKKSAGERTEFRMHGMKGPHSYQFGYDTGKGKNRQFRYEERDNDGHVRGHYGYVDKFGKLRVVNYDADPEHGFRAEAPVEKE